MLLLQRSFLWRTWCYWTRYWFVYRFLLKLNCTHDIQLSGGFSMWEWNTMVLAKFACSMLGTFLWHVLNSHAQVTCNPSVCSTGWMIAFSWVIQPHYKTMGTTPTRHSPNTVFMLVQRLRRWPNIKPALGECTLFAGKALMSTHALGSAVSRSPQ